MNKIIAVDIGGVIRTKNEHASIETDNYLEAPVVPGAKEGLAFLVEYFRAENVHLVSRCRLSKQKRSMEWLEHNGIFELGILRKNVHLCVGAEGKRACLKHLDPDILVDNRVDSYPLTGCVLYQLQTHKAKESWMETLIAISKRYITPEIIEKWRLFYA